MNLRVCLSLPAAHSGDAGRRDAPRDRRAAADANRPPGAKTGELSANGNGKISGTDEYW